MRYMRGLAAGAGVRSPQVTVRSAFESLDALSGCEADKKDACGLYPGNFCNWRAKSNYGQTSVAIPPTHDMVTIEPLLCPLGSEHRGR